ncbi:hypothetical protein RHSIM_Rhsim01G0156800 [Rhododendron simsii]|uniref:CCHC-type domain-containing protein n=1 Tax=Rhododendron simsii TaxID=118357 RepID=A0A834HGY9_RHOSS|nr:hypothetical protein RHSIM_Rhsim01G0156800 [Rhododendron simsii]
MRTIGLGYSPSSGSKVKKGDRLEDYFVKEKAKQIYQGQLEPFWDKETNTLLPRFEIFTNDVWPENDEEFEVAKKPTRSTDWIKVFNTGSLAILFREDEPFSSDRTDLLLLPFAIQRWFTLVREVDARYLDMASEHTVPAEDVATSGDEVEQPHVPLQAPVGRDTERILAAMAQYTEQQAALMQLQTAQATERGTGTGLLERFRKLFATEFGGSVLTKLITYETEDYAALVEMARKVGNDIQHYKDSQQSNKKNKIEGTTFGKSGGGSDKGGQQRTQGFGNQNFGKSQGGSSGGWKGKSGQGSGKQIAGGSTTTGTRQCFNCGSTDHLLRECTSGVKSFRCFACGETGHMAAQCPRRQAPAASCGMSSSP